ncbi:MAG: multicopper oxidase family protein [Alphaproteobacteria bacterium]|jgi:FtsP/CotA-like multicopper oxidase with cupredoxin domain|nr:multicopper oxidase family protein [Alphaproteobacteria bacterium]MBT4020171.1 multicopper oxidase family protein [Alphaproteobacteria bacterium]MBT4964642.1 multicopper oxidase family protein [Alphaproteobacteria bacterium]MBT5159279.1 multicopper oxidase family protein [Alphaproteobacteria bacterium]MBT6386572.1 multicopper oxidase family protein [Alphaproteobacteria bacterium]
MPAKTFLKNNSRKISRRDLLKAGTVAAITAAIPAGDVRSAPPTLVARFGSATIKAGTRSLDLPIWGYDGESPGRPLFVNQGGIIDLSLSNQLLEDTSIHWHGIRTPNKMDGVPFVTQKAVPPGGHFQYRFACEDAGTYWYHPHANSAEQIGRGLFGPLIVWEEKPLPVDRELVWMVADWLIGKDDKVSHNYAQMHDNSHAGRFGNLITVNGQHRPAIDAQPGERIRLRIINAASARILSFDFPGLSGWWIALDGQPIQPRGLGGNPLYIPPGGRADLVLDVPIEAKSGAVFGVADATYRNQRNKLASFRISGKQVRSTALAAPKKMADNPHSQPILDGANLKTVTFEGGAMGGLRSAMLDDKQMPLRQLAGKGVVWATNGKIWSSLEEIARQDKLFNLDLGKTYVFRLQNKTAFPHPIHLHGHSFQVIAVNGKKKAVPEWRDTVLVFPDEKVDIAFVADNPGDWLMHCHVLGHVTAGMIAAVRVG